MKIRKTISAGKFKAECLKIMDLVKESKRSVFVTKRNVPVVEIIPIEFKKEKIFGCMKGLIIYEGDIVSSIGVKWDADS